MKGNVGNEIVDYQSDIKMSFSVGIVGLPNVGKSTLFKALTKQQVAIEPRPFTTIKPNHGIVAVPDERLQKIASIIKPQKITPTIIEFVDIAGLVKEAHKGAGLGNQFLANIRTCDAICEVVRLFKNENIAHVETTLDPKRDIEIISTELLMKDLEVLEKIYQDLEKKKDKENQALFTIIKKIKENTSEGKWISDISLTNEEKERIKDFQFLTEKPHIFLLNIGKENIELGKKPFSYLEVNLKLEEELSDLSEKEYQELGLETGLQNLITACYKILGLVTFYTVAGGKETRAWTLKNGSKIIESAELVHSDFAQKFIKAEVINYKDLIQNESWKQAREKGQLQIVGKDYIVQDGDAIEFKI